MELSFKKTSVMLPQKEQNIYPLTKKNLKALLAFYFDKYDISKEGAIAFIRSKPSLSLNQIEFIIKNLSESYETVFQEYLKKSPVTATNLINYGFDALIGNKELLSGNSPRSKKTLEFLEYVKNASSTIQQTFPAPSLPPHL